MSAPKFSNLRLKGASTAAIFHAGSTGGSTVVLESLDSNNLSIVSAGVLQLGASSSTGLTISEDSTHVFITPSGSKALSVGGTSAFSAGGAVAVGGDLTVTGKVFVKIDGVSTGLGAMYAPAAGLTSLQSIVALNATAASSDLAAAQTALQTNIDAKASQAQLATEVASVVTGIMSLTDATSLHSKLVAAIARIADLESQFA